jgi:hypothetical protein
MAGRFLPSGNRLYVPASLLSLKERETAAVSLLNSIEEVIRQSVLAGCLICRVYGYNESLLSVRPH